MRLYYKIPIINYVGYFFIWLCLPIIIFWLSGKELEGNSIIVILTLLISYSLSRIVYLEDLIKVVEKELDNKT